MGIAAFHLGLAQDLGNDLVGIETFRETDIQIARTKGFAKGHGNTVPGALTGGRGNCATG